MQRILLRDRRAVGVRYERGGEVIDVEASQEVVLCAGAIQTPQILELSGVGGPDVLKDHGIDVVDALSGVGGNLQDHLQFRLMFRCKKPITTNDDLASWWRRIGIGFRYFVARSGPMAVSINHVGMFARALHDWKTPDVQFHIAAVTAESVAGKTHTWSGFTFSVCQLRPKSRDSIHIRSGNVADPPAIRANYLTRDEGWRYSIAGVRLARSLAAAPSMANYTQSTYRPASAADSDEEI